MISPRLLGACLLLAIFGWVSLGVADFNALYKFEVNAAPTLNYLAPSYLSFLQARSGELWVRLLPNWSSFPFVISTLLFFAPVLVGAFSRESRFLGRAMVGGLVLLALADIALLASFEGGDRKGCESCFDLFLLHVGFEFASVALGTIVLIWRAFQARGNRHHAGAQPIVPGDAAR